MTQEAKKGIRAIVGLGNPGPEYAETRHNAGFRFLVEVARAGNSVLRPEPRFLGGVCKVVIDGREVWLLAPQTYMNRSGDAVVRLAHYYKIAPLEILVVHDELDLPPGVVRVKRGGGAGGHNGLSDIISKLGSPDFMRLRLGIGRPGRGFDVANYVLKSAPPGEYRQTEVAAQEAERYLRDIVHGDWEKAMNALHRVGMNDTDQTE